MGIPVSVVILTKNEEINLGRCLTSLKWCDDIHVVDSGSKDGTLAIAEESTAAVYHHPFSSFGAQRNWSLENCALKNEWVLFLDADEETDGVFVSALESAVAAATENVAGFYCCWKTMLEGRWLKRSDSFPRWQFRLLRRGFAKFEDFGHSQRELLLKGEIQYLKAPYNHFPFRRGWRHWWNRHSQYADQEAQARLEHQADFKDLFSGDRSCRIKALKSFVSQVPGWPLIHFFVRYLLGLGFLEGVPGLIFCVNMSYYEFMIQLRMRELRREHVQ
jgi:glycosyltransferase involved in cell wall biosynthesis